MWRDLCYTIPPHGGICTRLKSHCNNGHPYDQKNTYITKTGKYQCRECHRLCENKRIQRPEIALKNKERAMAWIRNNREQYKQRVIEAKARYRQRFNALKASCQTCNESDVVCLDFHHRDPKTKLFNIGEQYGRHSWKDILLEVAKCDILCSNCHRKLHAKERMENSSSS